MHGNVIQLSIKYLILTVILTYTTEDGSEYRLNIVTLSWHIWTLKWYDDWLKCVWKSVLCKLLRRGVIERDGLVFRFGLFSSSQSPSQFRGQCEWKLTNSEFSFFFFVRLHSQVYMSESHTGFSVTQYILYNCILCLYVCACMFVCLCACVCVNACVCVLNCNKLLWVLICVPHLICVSSHFPLDCNLQA